MSSDKILDLSDKNIENGVELLSDLMNNHSDIVELNLAGNPLQYPYFPQNLNKLSNLRVLDITRINFSDFELISNCLSTLPELLDLKINLSSQQEALIILENIPRLQYLNNKSTKDDTHLVDIDDKDVHDISLTLEVTSFNETYAKISEILKSINKDQARAFNDEFYKLLKEEINNINQAVENTIPNYIYANKVLSSKVKIYKYFYDVLVSKAIPFTSDSLSFSLLIELNNKITSNTELFGEVIYKLYPKINEKTDSLKRQLDEALKGAQLVDEEIRIFEEKIEHSNKERDYIISQAKEERKQNLQKIEILENENRILAEKLIQNAKHLIEDNIKNPLDGSKKIPKRLNEIVKQDKKNVDLNNSQNNIENSKLEKTDKVNYDKIMNKSQLNSSHIVVSQRVLTPKMLKDAINEIYNSKQEFDIKCIESKMARETMEQHMYSFLNKKYGLKVSIFNLELNH